MSERPTVEVEACTANGIRILCAGFEMTVTAHQDGGNTLVVNSRGQKVEVRS